MRKLKAPAHFARQALMIAQRDREAWLRHAAAIKKKSKNHEWEESRYYPIYDWFFGKCLGHPLADELAIIYKQGREKFHTGKSRPLRVLEDGAGEGYFLEGLKLELSNLGVPTETTALVLDASVRLKEKKLAGAIDHIVSGRAEFFRPQRHFDAIISFYGSTSYAFPALRRTHLLKLAHSLRRGGLMLVGFYFTTEPSEQLYAIDRGLSPNPKKLRAEKGSAGLTLRVEMGGIEKAFAKIGFDAKFSFFGVTRSGSYLPNWALTVKRK